MTVEAFHISVPVLSLLNVDQEVVDLSIHRDGDSSSVACRRELIFVTPVAGQKNNDTFQKKCGLYILSSKRRSKCLEGCLCGAPSSEQSESAEKILSFLDAISKSQNRDSQPNIFCNFLCICKFSFKREAFIPLRRLINIESESERIARLARVAKEGHQWYLNMKKWCDVSGRGKPPRINTSDSKKRSGFSCGGGGTDPFHDLPPLKLKLLDELVPVTRFFAHYVDEKDRVRTLVFAASNAACTTIGTVAIMWRFVCLVLSTICAGYKRFEDDRIEISGNARAIVPELHVTGIVSPCSGKGTAFEIWTNNILPILFHARLSSISARITESKLHAESMACEPSFHNGRHVLVAVGGDGIVHEIVNGIAKYHEFLALKEQSVSGPALDSGALPHPAWVDVAPCNPGGYYEVSPTTRNHMPVIASIAAGSGCAVAKELDVLGFTEGALAIVHLSPITFDIFRVDPFDFPQSTLKLADDSLTSNERSSVAKRNGVEGCAIESCAKAEPRFIAFTIAFGAINEIDKGSESMRWLGNARFTVKTLTTIAAGAPEYRIFMRFSVDASFIQDGRVTHTRTQPSTAVSSWLQPNISRVIIQSICKFRYIARDIMMLPLAMPQDGMMDTCFIGPSEQGAAGTTIATSEKIFTATPSRLDAVKFFVDTEDGKHISDPRCSYVKARRMQVMPIDGNIMGDGEVLPKTGVTISIVRNAVVYAASPNSMWH